MTKFFVGCFCCPPDKSAMAKDLCAKCRPGTFRNRLSPAMYQRRPLGFFTRKRGSIGCSRCPAGTYQKEFEGTVCKPCPPRSDSFDGAKQSHPTCVDSPGCVSCRRGKAVNAQTALCEECPPNLASARTATACVVCSAMANDKRTKCIEEMDIN